MAKQLMFDEEARRSLKKGIDNFGRGRQSHAWA